ncbi:MAG: hypothetical protein ACRC68_05345 [Clostridium sp.]
MITIAKKIGISFKENELEEQIYNYLKKKSVLLGESTYIKQLILEKMQEEERTTK